MSDGVMLDIKAFDTGRTSSTVTDGTNEMVLKNAVYLARTSGKLFEVRAVIVPDLYRYRKERP